MELSRLRHVEPRSVWPHEAYDLTPWLLDNGDVLADVLGIDVELTVAEHPVGAFSLDLLGRDLTNDCVLIVDNQLTPTDHDHLGKLLTYAAGTDARTVVWLAPTFRDEHRQALDLLNDLGGERVRFFGVKLSAVRIDDSLPAPLLELSAQPNDWHSHLSAVANSGSRSGAKATAYPLFWARLLERVRSDHPDWTRARTAPSTSWLSMPCPFTGSVYSFGFARGGRLRSELYVDADDSGRAAGLFAALRDRRAVIEAAYGGELSWEERPDRRSSRIADYTIGNVLQSDDHDGYIDWFLDAGTRLRHAIGAVVAEVENELGEIDDEDLPHAELGA